MDDLELLWEFGRSGSAEAFNTLADRYLDLIYSAALRQVRDPHVADDVTQAVLIILMQRAALLPAGTIVPAWLMKVTRYVALDVIKIDSRRTKHEQAAAKARGAAVAELPMPLTPPWEKISPLIDAALLQLRRDERDAVVLRFLLKQSPEQIAWTLGVSEAAARKRVSRALARLRTIFARQGIDTADAALGAALAAHAVRPAPLAIHALARGLAARGGGTVSLPPAALAHAAARSLDPVAIHGWAVAAVTVAAAVALVPFWPRHAPASPVRRPAVHPEFVHTPLLPAAAVAPHTLIAAQQVDYDHLTRTRTRLMRAAERRDLPAVEQFLAAGDPVNEPSRDGTTSTALMLAVTAFRDENFKVVSRLVTARADVNTRYNHDYTVLMRAVRYRSPRTVQLLLDAGADPTLFNHRGETALDWARQQHSSNLVSILQAAVAATTQPTWNGERS